jgi:serine/threonine-protein kinase
MIVHNTYRIVRKLGRGGMGIVYLADQTYMQEQRALKFLSPELCEDEAFKNRFRQEVRALRQVRHKNVVDCGDLEPAEDDSLFFAMEFVDGPDLRDLMDQNNGPLEVELALAITRGIAEGLGAAHALGMVHRDIKPENILMARSGDSWVPKIADFGIVASKESSHTKVRTRTGGTLLTMAYAAPEQWQGMRSAQLDGRTDLYALGCVLFEMLTGRTAFDAESYEEWANYHKTVAPPAPSKLRSELRNWNSLDELTLFLLQKDRENRPRDTVEVAKALASIQYSPQSSPTTSPQQRPETVREETHREQPRAQEAPKATPRTNSAPAQRPSVTARETSAEPLGRSQSSNPYTAFQVPPEPDFPQEDLGLFSALRFPRRLLLSFGAVVVIFLAIIGFVSTGSTTKSPIDDGSLRGTVTSTSGKPISGAKVTLYNTLEPGPNGEPKIRETTSDADGNYIFGSLPESVAFFVSVDAAGFIGREGSAGTVSSGQVTRRDAVLSPLSRDPKKASLAEQYGIRLPL